MNKVKHIDKDALRQCFCGNTIVNGGAATDSSSCSAVCSGNSGEVCGGTYA